MKTLFIVISTAIITLFASMQAHAALENLGADSLGNNLIYDSDLDITWYDFSNSADLWQEQMNWADTLDVDFGGTHFTNWRLPTTVDGSYSFKSDGTSSTGFNITNSEMGHLYYTELGNLGGEDTSGNGQSVSGLVNTGDFQNLQISAYWAGTKSAINTNNSWYFHTINGSQGPGNMLLGNYAAIAVSDGRISLETSAAVAPEPLSTTLFAIGAFAMGFRMYRRQKL